MTVRIGLIGTSPIEVSTPIRANRFDRLQKQIGRLEDSPVESYPALHAACHLLMNGVDRVVFSGLCAAGAPKDWECAIQRLIEADDYHAVLIPGHPPGFSAALAARWEEMAPTVPLWVDVPDGSLEEQLSFRRALPSPHVHVVTPSIPTQSPGRRRTESLPGSILALPLALGTTRTLRGVHRPPATRPAEDLDARCTAGLHQLVVSAPSGRLRLRMGQRVQLADTAAPPQRLGLEAHVQDILRNLAEPLLLTERYDEALRKRLERSATVALEPLLRSGVIRRYHVRCSFADAATEPGFIFEVALEQPKRVQTLVLTINPQA